MIETETEYQAALKRWDQIFFANENTAEGEELEIIAAGIEMCENEHCPIDSPDPDEAIKIRAEEQKVHVTPDEVKREIAASRKEIGNGLCSSHEEVMERAIKFIQESLEGNKENKAK